MGTIPSMVGKTAVVTGATRGIGRAIADRLVGAGAAVWVVGRDVDRCRSTVEELRARGPNQQVDFLVADLADLSSVRTAASELLARVPRLDLLVNNAGAIFSHRQTTADGNERTLALNVLAPLALTAALRPALRAAAPARVVMIASAAHRGAHFDFGDPQRFRRYSAYRVYSESKLALILLTHELARRFAEDRIDVNAVHPGFVRTGFGRNNPGWFGTLFGWATFVFAIRPDRGSRTPLYAATDPGLTGATGLYFSRGHPVRSSSRSYDRASEARMWSLAGKLTGIADG